MDRPERKEMPEGRKFLHTHQLTIGEISGYNQALEDMDKWIKEADIEHKILDVQEELESRNVNVGLLASHRRLIAQAIRKLLLNDT